MSISSGSTFAAHASSASSVTVSVTTTGSNTYLVAGMGCEAWHASRRVISDVTFDGTSLADGSLKASPNQGNGNSNNAEIWGGAVANKTANLVITMPGSLTSLSVVAHVINAADTVLVGADASMYSSGASVAALSITTTESSSLVVETGTNSSGGTAITPDDGQTETDDVDASGHQYWHGYLAVASPAATDVDLSVGSSPRWAVCAVELYETAASGPTGTAAQTFGAFSQAGAGTTTIGGTAAQTFAAFSQASAGTTTVTGSATQSFGAFSQAAAGVHPAVGTAAQSFAAFSQVAAGETGSPEGTAAQSFGAFSQIAAGTTTVAGTAAQTFGAMSQAAAGTTTVVGTAAQTFGAMAQAAVGTTTIVGTAAQSFAAFSQTAAGTTAAPDGAAAQTFAAFSQAASGSPEIPATAAQTFGVFSQAAAGVHPAVGTAAQSFGAFAQSVAGVHGAPAVATTFDRHDELKRPARTALKRPLDSNF